MRRYSRVHSFEDSRMAEYKVISRRMLWTFISLKIVGLGKCYQLKCFLNKKADVNMVNVMSPFHFSCNIVLFYLLQTYII